MRAAAGLQNTKTLSVREQLSGRLFLADSGADVSVFPATESDKLASEGSCSLRAAGFNRKDSLVLDKLLTSYWWTASSGGLTVRGHPVSYTHLTLPTIYSV